MTGGEPLMHIDKRMLKVWRAGALLWGMLLLLCSMLAAAAAWRWEWPWWIALGLAAAGLFVVLLAGWVIPPVRWRCFRYEIREEEIDLQHGVFILKRTLIPMVRVQHVDSKSGPVMRKYGVASVTFSTAAGMHEIPGLSFDTADAVRNRIVELTRLAHEDI